MTKDWYLSTYNNLIEKSKQMKETIEMGVFHVHHIKPRCMGGGDELENLVSLTVRQHVIAHLLLSRAYPENNELLFAATMMTSVVDNKKRVLYRLPARLAATLIENYSKSQKGKVLSDEAKRKMSERLKGHKTSEETKKKISISEKGKIVPREVLLKVVNKRVITEEQRRVFSEQSKQRMKETGARDNLREKLKSRGDKNKTHGIKINVDGVDYPSLLDCSKSLGISTPTLRKWINGDIHTKHIINIQGEPTHYVIQGPDGIIYKSLTDCAKTTKHSKKTIRNWIQNYPELGYKIINNFSPKSN